MPARREGKRPRIFPLALLPFNVNDWVGCLRLSTISSGALVCMIAGQGEGARGTFVLPPSAVQFPRNKGLGVRFVGGSLL